jgi:t-SNARE complex subunit (syntaxin)
LKVFKKLKFTVNQNEIIEIVNCKPNAIEKLLFRLYYILVKKNIGNSNDNELLLGVSPSDDASKIKEEINKVQNTINELNYKKKTILETIDRLNGESLVYKRKIEELKQQEENMKSQQ